jgi:hypothetical protein
MTHHGYKDYHDYKSEHSYRGGLHMNQEGRPMISFSVMIWKPKRW